MRPFEWQDNNYTGKSQKEYNIFMLQLKNDFSIHNHYFISDAWKITYVSKSLINDFLLKWDSFSENCEPDVQDPTWKDFCDFLLHQINNPVYLQQNVILRYHFARQQSSQSVRDFFLYLQEKEKHLPEPFTERQCRDHLWVCVFNEMCIEAYKWNKDPTSYKGMVLHLQMVEEGMPNRRTALKNKRKNNQHISETSFKKSHFEALSESKPAKPNSGAPENTSSQKKMLTKTSVHTATSLATGKRNAANA
jgi:hypothetical protein